MSCSKTFTIFLLIICLFLAACNTAESPPPTNTQSTNAPIAQATSLPTIPPTNTLPATATMTLTPGQPTRTPFPTGTHTPPYLSPTPTATRPTSTPTSTPSVTPTLYPDAWVAGLLWDVEENILYVGSSSGVIYDARITYEPLNETVAANIDAITPGALVVFFGDFIPMEPHTGHIIVERVEQVSLPYSDETPMSAVYTHPNYGFSFQYPEGWRVRSENNDSVIWLANRSPDSDIYSGPGIAYADPTAIWLRFDYELMSLEEYVQSQRDTERIGDDVEFDRYRKIIVTEREFNGLPVTQIDIETKMWHTYREYVVSLDDDSALVIGFSIGDNHFAERLLTTLSVHSLEVQQDVWMAGVYRDYDGPFLLVGSSSGPGTNTTITFEPLNEETAETLDAIEPGTLIVLYGDYDPTGGDDRGHMFVERIEQVHLPYSESTPLSAVYTHPDNLYAFAYPENWTITAEDDGSQLTLENRTPDSYLYQGPGTENIDPTQIRLNVFVAQRTLDEYIQEKLASEHTGDDVPEQDVVEVFVTERQIGGLAVTQIDTVTYVYGRMTHRRYVIQLDETTLLVFSLIDEDAAFGERLLTTLNI